MKKFINTTKAPKAIGPYSQAVTINNMVFISGQIGINPESGDFAGNDIQSQTEQCFKNIFAILEEARFHKSDIVKINISILNMEDFPIVNQIYNKHIKEPYPARACVAVKQLPKNALIEIETIAAKCS